MGNKKRAFCFATWLQNESNCGVAHFTIHESNLSATNQVLQVAKKVFVESKGPNNPNKWYRKFR